MTDTLKLVARRAMPSDHGQCPGGPMVPDYEAQAIGRRSFIGRYLDTTNGVPFTDPADGSKKRHAVFMPLEGDEAIVEKPATAEYLRHLHPQRFGGHANKSTLPDLIPGDEATAKFAGVKFDPTFAMAAAERVGSVSVFHADGPHVVPVQASTSEPATEPGLAAGK